MKNENKLVEENYKFALEKIEIYKRKLILWKLNNNKKEIKKYRKIFDKSVIKGDKKNNKDNNKNDNLDKNKKIQYK